MCAHSAGWDRAQWVGLGLAEGLDEDGLVSGVPGEAVLPGCVVDGEPGAAGM